MTNITDQIRNLVREAIPIFFVVGWQLPTNLEPLSGISRRYHSLKTHGFQDFPPTENSRFPTLSLFNS